MYKSHTDRIYEEQLQQLRQALLLMAGRVENMIAEAMQALVNRDAERARLTIEQDHKVNKAERDTDELCLLILAKRQPLASDLRFIALSLKMVTDIERIGDLAVNIAERTIDLSRQPPLINYDRIAQMGQLAQSMLHDAIDAFVSRNQKLAKSVVKHDDEVDDLYGQLFNEILEVMRQDNSATHRGIHVLSIAKWIERIADHATNLAEQVVFMVRGKDIRHKGKLNS